MKNKSAELNFSGNRRKSLASIITLWLVMVFTLQHSFARDYYSLPENLFGQHELLIMPDGSDNRSPEKDLQAQPRLIKGSVSDEEGQPLVGVSIIVKGTTIGAITDLNGLFSIQVPAESNTLAISFVGMETLEVDISSQTNFNFIMKASSIGLEEVVAIGYGTISRRDLTGSVSSVKRERFDQMPNSNFAQAIQGSVPGVTITANSAGAEQNDLAILIRGRNSITASNNPLIVLDGIPFSGRITEISPSDIESIEILKDASSVAIYGSRGSNGVILISTIKGKKSKPTFSYDGHYGMQTASNIPELLDGKEFYEYKNQREPGTITAGEEEIYQSGEWVDWLDLILQNGQRQQHALTVSGGTENINYYLSGMLMDVKGITLNDVFKRYSFRYNIGIKLSNWLEIGTNTQMSLSDRSGLTPSFSGAYYTIPLARPYHADGKLNIYPNPADPAMGNPLSNIYVDDMDKTYKIFSNNYIDIKLPVEGLSYRFNAGIGLDLRDVSTYYNREETQAGFEKQGVANLERVLTNDYLIENIVNYQRTFNKHKILATGLYGYQLNTYVGHSLDSEGFPSDVLGAYQANVATLITPSDEYSRFALISQMLRLNYSYDGKYLLTVTGRKDGYSGFGDNNKYGIYPSVALGWNISQEEWLRDLPYLAYAKLRVSYGSNGNQAVGTYNTLARLSERSFVDGNITAPGYFPTKLGNPDLGWETSTTFNAGIDFGFLEGRLQGTFDRYLTQTTDLLLNRQISSVHGITSITQNIGKTRNKGIEMSLSGDFFRTSQIKYSTSMNLSLNTNEIVDLYGNNEDDVLNSWFLGKPIRVDYRYEYGGVWQTGEDIANSAQPDANPGWAKIIDQNDDKKIDDEDRVIMGQLDPKYVWGWSNTVSFKRFSFYFLAHGMGGNAEANELLNDNVVFLLVRRNTPKLNWWTPDNPTNDYWVNHIDANKLGVRIVEKRDFIRLKDISLSYSLPSLLLNRIGFEEIKVYLTGRNLITITDWSGLDPELGNQRAVPMQKEYLVGLNFSF